MTDFNQNVDQAKDLLNLEQKDMAKLPSMLNVLTILTYVGCAFAAIGGIYNYFTIGASYALVEKMTGSGSELDKLGGGKAFSSIMSASTEMLKKQYENRLVLLLIALAGAGLCFYGAMQMRNLKKQGYLFYVIGELLPVLGVVFLVGFGSIFAGVGIVLSLLFPALFIILYTTQKKYLVN